MSDAVAETPVAEQPVTGQPATEATAPEPVKGEELFTGPVTVGEKEVKIARFKGLKGIMAGALVADVMEKVPELNDKIAENNKKFRENNYVEVTRGMKKLPAYARFSFTEEDFDANGGPIRIPLEVGVGTQIQWIFPELWKVASKELQRFFALLAISNKELEEADDADDIDGVLTAKGRELIREADIDELLELFLVSWNVLREQILRKRERLEKLSDLSIVEILLSMLETTPSLDNEDTTLETSSDDAPISSTDSGDSTDGQDEKPSTESPGSSSPSSSPSTTK